MENGVREDVGCPRSPKGIYRTLWSYRSVIRLWVDLINRVFDILVPTEPKVSLLGYVGDLLGDSIEQLPISKILNHIWKSDYENAGSR